MDELERQVEALYERIQLRPEMGKRLMGWLESELIAREDRNAAEREFQSRRLARVESDSRKALDAYYAGALDVTMLRQEQDHLRRERDEVNERLRDVDATLAQWQGIFDIAVRFATTCGAAYRKAPESARKLYNRALFDRLLVIGGRIAEPVYVEPFRLVFGLGEFEYGSLELHTWSCSNLSEVRGRVATLSHAASDVLAS